MENAHTKITIQDSNEYKLPKADDAEAIVSAYFHKDLKLFQQMYPRAREDVELLS